jgi:hypothetical protein
MKTTSIEKLAVRKNRTNRTARRVSLEAPRVTQASPKADADRQIAEIERTFTLRYEW